MMNSKPSTPTN